MLDLAGKKVLVIGLGVSGKSAAAFCAARGAQVLACDERADVCASGLPPEVELRRGALPDPAAFDLVVPSPGVPPRAMPPAPAAFGAMWSWPFAPCPSP